MPNDLRDPNFRPGRQQSAKKNSGCALGPILGVIIAMGLISGLADSDAAASAVGLIFVLLFVGLIAGAAASAARKNRRAAKQRGDAPARRAPAEDCPNPEPHRHHNPSRPAAAHGRADKRWPTPLERREENLRHLYEAGLLTREEYQDMLRKARAAYRG